jgi:hypothetical protein
LSTSRPAAVLEVCASVARIAAASFSAAAACRASIVRRSNPSPDRRRITRHVNVRLPAKSGLGAAFLAGLLRAGAACISTSGSCPIAPRPLKAPQMAGLNRHCHFLFDNEFQPRVSSDNPMLNAFCRVAPSVRFSVFAIFPAGFFCFARTFKVRICSVVHALRLDGFFAIQ